MAARAPSPLPRVSVMLAVILLVAIALGAAATFLSAPVAPAPPVTPADRTASEGTNIAEGAAGLFVAILVLLVLARISAGRSTGMQRYAVNMLMVLTVGVLFIALFHFVATGGDLGGAQPGNGTENGTPPDLPPPPPTGSNNTTGPFFPPTIPSWVEYLGLTVAALVAVLILVPLARARQAGKGDTIPVIAPVQRSFEQALAALRDPGSEDPRATVIALYAQLLRAVAPYLEEMVAATPREIERECVARLHLQPQNARALTGLFEEARYSTHPFSDDQVDRARAALTAALVDLGVPKGVPA